MSPPVRLLRSGPHAVLAEYDSLDDVLRVAAQVRSAAPTDVLDLVPAARTILLTVRDGVDPMSRASLLSELLSEVPVPDATSGAIVPAVSVEVGYDGPDLLAVAQACALSVEQVISIHSAAEYTVAFCGFMPGFSYLVGLDARLHLPRRATPRTRVPAGSVAIANELSAVYPLDSPGGWHVLGRTDSVMWDEDREVPALLPPGARVRFVPR